MSKRTSTCSVLIAAVAVAPVAWTEAAQDAAPQSPEVQCSSCHTCDQPTHEKLCLRRCTRDEQKPMSELEGPEGVILLDMLSDATEGEDRFGPVPFDHSGHVRMARMGEGCGSCHHYTPEGSAQPACRTCHEPTLRREDISKPSLKGAYHRQCMGCHREWAHDTDCRQCHLAKVGSGQTVDLSQIRTYMASKHPPIAEPEVEIYELGSAVDVGSKVIFRHKEHTQRYGFACVECHQGDNCMRCHENGKKHAQRVRTFEDHHKPCLGCHARDARESCQRCHYENGQPPPPPFDHALTGWALSRYHADNACRDCHREVPLKALDSECDACHSDWNSDNFDHAVTGQVLSPLHRAADCVDCHLDRAFNEPPTCDECHSQEEGIAFPAQRPGPHSPKAE